MASQVSQFCVFRNWVLGLALLSASLDAQERVALVIGNDAYPSKPLLNAVGDATAVRDLLKDQLGFAATDIVFGTNLNRLQFFEKLEAVKERAGSARIVLVYYAGHGMESLDGKENFLVPVDADINRVLDSEAALRASGVNMLGVMADLAKVSGGAKIVLMDCCRERPLNRGASRAGGGMATYADDQIPADTLMLLAAAPARLASDGRGHGPFTRALLENLPDPPGRSILDTFFSVSDRVQALTAGRQVPWMKFDGSGRLFRETVLMPRSGDSPPPVDRARAATKEAPFVNSLGLEFTPLPPSFNLLLPSSRKVLLCRTETRVRDFRAYATASGYRQSGGAYVMKVKTTPEGGPTTAWELDAAASWENPGFSQSEDHPVTCVSWDEANAFCAWLTAQSSEKGLTYRLPTDAEWSLAVGSVGKYPWGNDLSAVNGNYWDQTIIKTLPKANWPEITPDYDDGAAHTAQISSYPANANGFHDLGGNVWEWCEDVYQESMNDEEALTRLKDLRQENLGESEYRVVRGNAWLGPSEILLRSNLRSPEKPSDRNFTHGFRLVLEIEKES